MGSIDLTLSLCFPACGDVQDGPRRRAERGGPRRPGTQAGVATSRCRAAAGVVNQAVTSRRTATSQHQGRTTPRFDRQPERSGGGSRRQAGDVEHLLAASTRAQTCKGNQVLNSYLGTSLPLKSEIEVRPLNISVGLAPRPCLASAVQSSASTGTGQCLHAPGMFRNG